MDDDGWCAPRSAAKVQKVPSRRGSCSSARPQLVSHGFSKWGGFTLTFADMCGYFNGKKIIINQDKPWEFDGFRWLSHDFEEKTSPWWSVDIKTAQRHSSWGPTQPLMGCCEKFPTWLDHTRSRNLWNCVSLGLFLRSQSIIAWPNCKGSKRICTWNKWCFIPFFRRLSANPYPTTHGCLVSRPATGPATKSEAPWVACPRHQRCRAPRLRRPWESWDGDAWRIIPVVS